MALNILLELDIALRRPQEVFTTFSHLKTIYRRFEDLCPLGTGVQVKQTVTMHVKDPCCWKSIVTIRFITSTFFLSLKRYVDVWWTRYIKTES